ncbi:hypothetical protein ABKN59_011112 [Abortiporus biennis]
MAFRGPGRRNDQKTKKIGRRFFHRVALSELCGLGSDSLMGAMLKMVDRVEFVLDIKFITPRHIRFDVGRYPSEKIFGALADTSSFRRSLVWKFVYQKHKHTHTRTTERIQCGAANAVTVGSPGSPLRLYQSIRLYTSFTASSQKSFKSANLLQVSITESLSHFGQQALIRNGQQESYDFERLRGPLFVPMPTSHMYTFRKLSLG